MISFIIPTLNEEKVLEDTLKNLTSYSGDKEIIISDGISRDKTLEIARKYTDRIFVYDGKTRQTIADARNVGGFEAKGEYLVFIDADTHIPEINVFFSKALQIFEADKKVVALAVAIRVFKEMETFMDWLVFSSMDIVHNILNNITKIGGAPGEFQMIRSDAFRQVGGYDKRLVGAEDHEFLRRLAKIGRVRFDKNLRIYHTGRRAHKVGWPKLLWSWTLNGLYFVLFKRSKDKEWKEVR